MNDSSTSDFYLVKIEAVKIADSPPAALFTLITGPSEESASASEAKRELNDRQKMRLKFWTNLLTHSKQRTKLHSGISPTSAGWIGSGAGLPAGLSLNYVVRTNDARVELYIDGGTDSDDENLNQFQKIFARKDKIEAKFDDQIVWEPLDGKRACRISSVVAVGGWKDEDIWDDIATDLVDRMIKFERAIKPFVK